MADEGVPPRRLQDDRAKLVERFPRRAVPVEDRAFLWWQLVVVNRVAPDKPAACVALVDELGVLRKGFREARDELLGKVGWQRTLELEFAAQRIRRLLEQEAFVGPAAGGAKLDKVEDFGEREHLRVKRELVSSSGYGGLYKDEPSACAGSEAPTRAAAPCRSRWSFAEAGLVG